MPIDPARRDVQAPPSAVPPLAMRQNSRARRNWMALKRKIRESKSGGRFVTAATRQRRRWISKGLPLRRRLSRTASCVSKVRGGAVR